MAQILEKTSSHESKPTDVESMTQWAKSIASLQADENSDSASCQKKKSALECPVPIEKCKFCQSLLGTLYKVYLTISSNSLSIIIADTVIIR